MIALIGIISEPWGMGTVDDEDGRRLYQGMTLLVSSLHLVNLTSVLAAHASISVLCPRSPTLPLLALA